MKVLIVISDPEGGAAESLKNIVDALQRSSIECFVITGSKTGLNERLDKMNVANISAGYADALYIPEISRRKRPLGYIKSVSNYFKKLRRALCVTERNADMKNVDVICTNIDRIDFGCVLSKKYDIPHVMFIREFANGHFDLRFLRPGYYKYLNRHCDVILAVSDAVRRDWIKKGIDPKKCRTLYDGVDFSDFTVKPEDSYGGGTLKLVVVSRIYEAKGQLIAVKAVNALPEHIKNNVTLDLIGFEDPWAGKYVSEIKNEIENNGLSGRVRFMGQRYDIGELLCGYDVGINCSRAEGFGRVTAEYMYAGLGVAVTNTGASPELVDNGKNGLVFTQDDPGSLAKCIERFYGDRHFLKMCGLNAHKKAAEMFDLRKNIDDIISVYEEVSHCRIPAE